MTTPELLATISTLQANLASYQSMLAARMAAADVATVVRSTARKVHADQTPMDVIHASVWNVWNNEEASNSDPAVLWTQPEHSFWFRAARTAIIAGVVEPVGV